MTINAHQHEVESGLNWLSGFAVIGFGVLISGAHAYFANPKLLAKLVVVLVWFMSTQTIRRYAV